ncbi:hypothetical protein [Bythopirellula polymerisocia]|uniref:Tetratricopeptide repeat-like domain-containing protein n=1 Tax=Bythopirellula polymerisocia TaxID=2528003 RepID=A0A5C6CNJ5_9BACT|nr:hypothetical protein [Bythopirellula polymerisocia]TWU26100.1 hypothetical protein Pla144_33170 [Bythopirellula polymerisocia]
MKSERRHDLETNELAVSLRSTIDKAKPYHTHLLVGAAIVAVLIALWGVWGTSSSVTEQEAWDKFILASYSSDPELLEMKRLADNSEYTGTTVPEWAYLMWCDRQLLIASQSFLVDRAASTSRLKQIQGIYEGLITGASVSQIRDRARYGLAQVYELQDKLEEAQEKYVDVKGDLSTLATNRTDQLKEKEVIESSTWLATAELPKRKAATPGTTNSGSRPSFEAEVPKSLSSPTDIQDSRSLEDILTGANGAGADEDRYKDSPAEDATDATDVAPAEDQPAGENAKSTEETSEGQ